MSSTRTLTFLIYSLAVVSALVANLDTAQAGCPFDDGSCQEYCTQQGCNLGYCGHFAWIQCICRKCGDEWNWYDKVHYNPDKQFNQTELDSLKLNVSIPLILTSNNNVRRTTTTTTTEQQEKVAPTPVAAPGQQVLVAQQPKQSNQLAAIGNPQQAIPLAAPQHLQQEQKTQQPQQQKVTATLTTLLIPDLSDGSKLDLNDIPDENSEKFLDYLTKNHEKLVQATNSAQQGVAGSSARSASFPSSSSSSPLSSSSSVSSPETDDETDSEDMDAEQQATTPDSSSNGELQADEAVEIQISSSNNNQPSSQQTTTATTTTTVTPTTVTGSRSASQTLASSDGATDNEQQQQARGGSMMRLLKMAVVQRSLDDIF